MDSWGGWVCAATTARAAQADFAASPPLSSEPILQVFRGGPEVDQGLLPLVTCFFPRILHCRGLRAHLAASRVLHTRTHRAPLLSRGGGGGALRTSEAAELMGVAVDELKRRMEPRWIIARNGESSPESPSPNSPRTPTTFYMASTSGEIERAASRTHWVTASSTL